MMSAAEHVREHELRIEIRDDVDEMGEEGEVVFPEPVAAVVLHHPEPEHVRGEIMISEGRLTR